MNVDDTKAPKPTGDRLQMMFDRQRELMEKYHDIERRNGLGLGAMKGEFDIDSARWQYLMKDYAWRVTEELAEATEVKEHQIHRWEEAVDALHFLLELLIVTGEGPASAIDHAGLPDAGEDMLTAVFRLTYRDVRLEIPQWHAYRVVQRLGSAMNCLKNKPWKITQMETDGPRFRSLLCSAFCAWVEFALSLGMTADDAYDLYFRKSEVNKFRQRSDY